jgi:hypothetical protein
VGKEREEHVGIFHNACHYVASNGTGQNDGYDPEVVAWW